MPVNIGPIKVKLEVDREAFKEDMAEMLGEINSPDEGGGNKFFENLFGDPADQFEDLISNMLDLENASVSVTKAVNTAFNGLRTTLDIVGIAWQEMLLSGEISLKTFGQAVQAMVAQELAAISASALVRAIYATAIGFLNLALFNPAAAAAAFTAAAVFATVAAVAGIGAIALAPKGGGGGFDDGFDDGLGVGQTDQVESRNQQRFLNLTIEGNILGNEEFVREILLPQLNSLVQESDAVLVSSSRDNLSRNIR